MSNRIILVSSLSLVLFSKKKNRSLFGWVFACFFLLKMKANIDILWHGHILNFLIWYHIMASLARARVCVCVWTTTLLETERKRKRFSHRFSTRIYNIHCTILYYNIIKPFCVYAHNIILLSYRGGIPNAAMLYYVPCEKGSLLKI